MDVSLAAVLIVRDEESMLPGCLDSLLPLVDAVHVHDTGSTDATVAIARDRGAAVTTGPWTGDFSAARNAALAGCTAEWALSVDADERLHSDPGALGALLAGARRDALTVEIDNRHEELPYTHRGPRLFRPAVLRWSGRVHEQLVGAGGPAVTASAPRAALYLEHLGYAAPAVRRAKSERNAALAQATLEELAAQGHAADPVRAARTLLDLGRSLVGAERAQDAVDSFELLRELFPGTPEAAQGTDAFARLLLANGMDEAALTVTEQLRAAGAPAAYCDWLAAQALAQLGEVEHAWALVGGIGEVVDVAGRRYAPEHLQQFRELLGELRQAR